MSIELMTEAFKVRGLRPTEKLVLLKLADHANDDGLCYPAQASIAAILEITVRTVRTITHHLAELGHLTINADNGNVHVYTVHPKAPKTDPGKNFRGVQKPRKLTSGDPGSRLPGTPETATSAESPRTINQSESARARAPDPRPETRTSLRSAIPEFKIKTGTEPRTDPLAALAAIDRCKAANPGLDDNAILKIITQSKA